MFLGRYILDVTGTNDDPKDCTITFTVPEEDKEDFRVIFMRGDSSRELFHGTSLIADIVKEVEHPWTSIDMVIICEPFASEEAYHDCVSYLTSQDTAERQVYPINDFSDDQSAEFLTN